MDRGGDGADLIQGPEIYLAGRSLSDLRLAARADRSAAATFWAMLLALVVTGLVIGAFLWVGNHPPFRSDARLDVVDIAVVGLVPGIVTAVLTGDPGAAPGIATFVLIGVGIIYAVVALGIPELIDCSLRHLRENLPHIATLVVRTLPLLLILVVFLSLPPNFGRRRRRSGSQTWWRCWLCWRSSQASS